MSDEPTEQREGRCEWCRGSDEGGETIASSSGYWWHADCAEHNLAELEEALG